MKAKVEKDDIERVREWALMACAHPKDVPAVEAVIAAARSAETMRATHHHVVKGYLDRITELRQERDEALYRITVERENGRLLSLEIEQAESRAAEMGMRLTAFGLFLAHMRHEDSGWYGPWEELEPFEDIEKAALKPQEPAAGKEKRDAE